MEEREPNLVASTTHSISRRGVRRSELDDVELRNILGSLLPLVRIDYILPPFHQSSLGSVLRSSLSTLTFGTTDSLLVFVRMDFICGSLQQLVLLQLGLLAQYSFGRTIPQRWWRARRRGVGEYNRPCSLNSAYKRGLLDRSPNADLLGQRYPDSRSPDVSPDAHWFDHSVPRRHPAGPRLLLPYITVTMRGVVSDRMRIALESTWAHVVNLTPEVVSEQMRALAYHMLVCSPEGCCCTEGDEGSKSTPFIAGCEIFRCSFSEIIHFVGGKEDRGDTTDKFGFGCYVN
uniref:Uncharacterized protein n=1 Tax=Parascaris equorum TaxID=6256 RepID=A0A914RDQ2_PAREQ